MTAMTDRVIEEALSASSRHPSELGGEAHNKPQSANR